MFFFNGSLSVPVFFFFSLAVAVAVPLPFLSNKRRLGLSPFREESPSEPGNVILTLLSKREGSVLLSFERSDRGK